MENHRVLYHHHFNDDGDSEKRVEFADQGQGRRESVSVAEPLAEPDRGARSGGSAASRGRFGRGRSVICEAEFKNGAGKFYQNVSWKGQRDVAATAPTTSNSHDGDKQRARSKALTHEGVGLTERSGADPVPAVRRGAACASARAWRLVIGTDSAFTLQLPSFTGRFVGAGARSIRARSRGSTRTAPSTSHVRRVSFATRRADA